MECKKEIIQDRNFDIIPKKVVSRLMIWYSFASYLRVEIMAWQWKRNRYAIINDYIRDNSNNEEHRETVFSDRVFNNVPIDKDRL